MYGLLNLFKGGCGIRGIPYRPSTLPENTRRTDHHSPQTHFVASHLCFEDIAFLKMQAGTECLRQNEPPRPIN